jgi:hypothetical protein
MLQMVSGSLAASKLAILARACAEGAGCRGKRRRATSLHSARCGADAGGARVKDSAGNRPSSKEPDRSDYGAPSAAVIHADAPAHLEQLREHLGAGKGAWPTFWHRFVQLTLSHIAAAYSWGFRLRSFCTGQLCFLVIVWILSRSDDYVADRFARQHITVKWSRHVSCRPHHARPSVVD